MVSNKQRQRKLARAKWERQRSRRADKARRTRRVQLVVGALVGLVAAAALVWVVLWVVDQDDARTPDQVTPSNTDQPSFISPPTETTGSETAPTTPSPETATSTQGTTR